MKDMLVKNKCIGKMSPNHNNESKEQVLKNGNIDKLKTSLLEAIIVNSLCWGY